MNTYIKTNIFIHEDGKQIDRQFDIHAHICKYIQYLQYVHAYMHRHTYYLLLTVILS